MKILSDRASSVNHEIPPYQESFLPKGFLTLSCREKLNQTWPTWHELHSAIHSIFLIR